MFVELCCVHAASKSASGVEHLEGAAVPEGDEIAQSRTKCERSFRAAELFGEVQHLDRAAELAREGARRSVQPAADVEHPHPHLAIPAMRASSSVAYLLRAWS